tara:strand:+ start:1588 stop:1950 length:363 start_codon:yes stop_codon:yes gene_type:complete
MADLTGTYIAANFQKHVISQSGVGRELIVKVAKTNMTDSELNTIIHEITVTGGAGADAFTIGGLGTATGAAFVSGTTDVVFLRLQGTGTYTADGTNAHGVADAVTTIEAIFQPEDIGATA